MYVCMYVCMYVGRQFWLSKLPLISSIATICLEIEIIWRIAKRLHHCVVFAQCIHIPASKLTQKFTQFQILWICFLNIYIYNTHATFSTVIWDCRSHVFWRNLWCKSCSVAFSAKPNPIYGTPRACLKIDHPKRRNAVNSSKTRNGSWRLRQMHQTCCWCTNFCTM